MGIYAEEAFCQSFETEYESGPGDPPWPVRLRETAKGELIMAEEYHTKVTIGPVPIWWFDAFKPTPGKDGKGKLKYRATPIIPKEDTETILKCIEAVKQAALKGIDDGKFTPADAKVIIDNIDKKGGLVALRSAQPIRDGDHEAANPTNKKGAEHHGIMFFNATSDSQPGVVDKYNDPIIAEGEIYSGVVGYIQINFYAWDAVSKRVCAGLQNFMKTDAGTKMGGRDSTEEAFAGLQSNKEIDKEMAIDAENALTLDGGDGILNTDDNLTPDIPEDDGVVF